MQTELTCQRFTFWSKCSQYFPKHFLSKEAFSVASYLPNFLHVKMTTIPIFPIDISPFIPTKYLAFPPPLQAVLMRAVHKRQTFWVILFMGKIMGLWHWFEFWYSQELLEHFLYRFPKKTPTLSDRNYEYKCWEWVVIN